MMDFLIVKLWLFELSPYTHLFECLVLSNTVWEGLEGVAFGRSCVTREWALSFQKLKPGQCIGAGELCVFCQSCFK